MGAALGGWALTPHQTTDHDNSVPYVAEGMSPKTLNSQQETYAAGLSFSGGPCTTYESAGGVGAEGRNTGQWSPAGFGYV